MQILKHLTANNIHLEAMPFQRELSMEAYLIENEGVLALDNEIFDSVEIIEAELTLKQGRKSKDTDGRIDILVKYSEEYLGIVELKLGQLDHIHLEQLEDYLDSRESLLLDYPDLITQDLIEKPKWLGILVGSSISPDLERKLTDGYLTRHGITVMALTIQRFRGNDGQIYVVTDTYANLKKSEKDYTRYFFNAKTYGKGRLVLAVVSHYIVEHPNVTFSELLKIFPKHIQGRRGVFDTLEAANELYTRTSRKRHFLKPDEVLRLSDTEIAVDSGWGIKNIVKFISAAESLGYKIEPRSG